MNKLTKEEALEALEGCWDGIEEDGIKIQALIEAHFDMAERVKKVKEVVQSLQILMRSKSMHGGGNTQYYLHLNVNDRDAIIKATEEL